jgi:hypothetical protein
VAPIVAERNLSRFLHASSVTTRSRLNDGSGDAPQFLRHEIRRTDA